MKRFVVVVLAMSLGMCVVGLAGESEREELFSPQTGVRFLDEGHLGGQIGLRIRYQDIEQVDEGDAGWIYLIPNWESGEIIDGLTLGLGGIVVQELWDDDGFEDTLDPGSSDDATWAGRFGDDLKGTEGYLKYAFPETDSYMIAGCAASSKFGKPKSGNGDFWEGVGVTIGDMENVTFRGSVVYAWLDNAQQSWLYNIDKSWQDLENSNDEADSVAFTVMAEWDAVPDSLTLTPYVQYQGDVATSLGLTVKGRQKINDRVTLGLDSTCAFHEEDNDLYEDVQQYLLHSHVQIDNLKLGAGYYGISDDSTAVMGQFVAFPYDGFIGDMRGNSVLGKGYAQAQDNDTCFLTAQYKIGKFLLKAKHGWCRDALDGLGTTGGKARETNFIAKYHINDRTCVTVVYVGRDDMNEDDGADLDAHCGVLQIGYSF